MVSAVNETLAVYFILKPKYTRSSCQIEGRIWRVYEEKVIIEISECTFNFVLKTHEDELYDIIFVLNRLPFQLQHYALNTILQSSNMLFNKLINNSGQNEPVQNQLPESMPFLM